MAYIELFSNELLDLVNIGKTLKDFDEKRGDYIKVQIFKGTSNKVLGTLHSNRLLLKYPEGDDFYLGNYHFHQENPSMGFCTGRIHDQFSKTNLLPILIGNSLNEPLNIQTVYKKQLDIFKDDKDRIYLKPNEIIKLLNLPKDKYRLRIFFLRNIKSTLGVFLGQNKNNLIENGNFFAGLEATQTGDLDKSSGKNNFIRVNNPGFSPYVLNQNGLPDNRYTMRVTGIEPNSSYVFSCWVAWDENYDGGTGIAYFTDVKMGYENTILGLVNVDNTDLGGSFINDYDDRILNKKEIGGLTWYKLYSFVRTNNEADLGSMLVHVGANFGTNFKPSKTPLSNRYFTDLRLEKVNSLVGSDIVDYLNKLKEEIDIGNIFKDIDLKRRIVPEKEFSLPEPSEITPEDFEEELMKKAVESAVKAASSEDILAQFMSDKEEITTDVDPTTAVEKKQKASVRAKSGRRRRRTISFRRRSRSPMRRRGKSWANRNKRSTQSTSKNIGGLRRGRNKKVSKKTNRVNLVKPMKFTKPVNRSRGRKRGRGKRR